MENMTIGEKIMIYRRRKGMTQPELAAKAGVSVMTISRIEKGNEVPLTVTIKAISDVLGINLEDLKGDNQ